MTNQQEHFPSGGDVFSQTHNALAEQWREEIAADSAAHSTAIDHATAAEKLRGDVERHETEEKLGEIAFGAPKATPEIGADGMVKVGFDDRMDAKFGIKDNRPRTAGGRVTN